MNNHWAVFLSNNANKYLFMQELLEGKATGKLAEFNTLKGEVFSDHLITEIIEEEYRHDRIEVAKEKNRSFRTLSGGEQRRSLLNYCLSKNPDYLILDNPFDNLDIASQQPFRILLEEIAQHASIIQLIHRKTDVLNFISNTISIDDSNTITYYDSKEIYLKQLCNNSPSIFKGVLPLPIDHIKIESTNLVSFNDVSVIYDERTILKSINWEINAGEFWQLIGPNGSGKTTLLSMIIGDNPQGYGQDLVLFGKRKGSGESVWEIKEKVGYFTPAMTDLFSKYFTVEHMIISGFFDSIGLYIQPTDLQIKLANEWLSLINLQEQKHVLLSQLSLGQQRMVLIARAMVKHPPLLILDEPISGLDDDNAQLIISLINKISEHSKTAIVYVSHRIEETLTPNFIFELMPSTTGSIGKRIKQIEK